MFFQFLTFFLVAGAKPTHQPSASTPQAIHLYLDIRKSPRSRQDIENFVLLNPQVQGCLRSAVMVGASEDAAKTAAPVRVNMKFRVTSDGGPRKIQVKAANETLRRCLLEVSKSLAFGTGRAGEMDFEITQNGSLPHKKKGKPVTLDLESIRKFE